MTMGGQKDYTRRAFLKRFAMLSSATMLMGMGIGCGSNYEPGNNFYVAYGPPPTGATTVTGIYFIDSQSTQVLLQGAQAVPLHTQFIIDFSADMSMSSVADAITFIDAANQPVVCSKEWDTTNSHNRTINVIPVSDLSHDASYSLSVGYNALDSSGLGLLSINDASAAFKTIP
jgi:hypothetical protein